MSNKPSNADKKKAEIEAYRAASMLMTLTDEQLFWEKHEQLHHDLVVGGKGEKYATGRLMGHIIKNNWVGSVDKLLNWAQKHNCYNYAWNTAAYRLTTIDVLDVLLKFDSTIKMNPKTFLDWRIRLPQKDVFQRLLAHVVVHHPTCNFGLVAITGIHQNNIDCVTMLVPHMNKKQKLNVLTEAALHNQPSVIDLVYTAKNGLTALKAFEALSDDQYDPKGLAYLHALVQHDLLSAEVGDTAQRPRKPKM